jgi:hypothetical protein
VLCALCSLLCCSVALLLCVCSGRRNQGAAVGVTVRVEMNGTARTTMNLIAVRSNIRAVVSYPPVIQTSRPRRKNFAEGNDLGRPGPSSRQTPPAGSHHQISSRPKRDVIRGPFPGPIGLLVGSYPQPRIPRTTCVICYAGDPRPSGAPQAHAPRDLRNPCARTPQGPSDPPDPRAHAPLPGSSASGPTSPGAAPAIVLLVKKSLRRAAERSVVARSRGASGDAALRRSRRVVRPARGPQSRGGSRRSRPADRRAGPGPPTRRIQLPG